ncbi:MAG TPA: hypothetical protein VMV92_01850 [Streptosporangiaceae bacterium]|nr:hypothetical protein [Streptosporangiaceae bacterium]
MPPFGAHTSAFIVGFVVFAARFFGVEAEIRADDDPVLGHHLSQAVWQLGVDAQVLLPVEHIPQHGLDDRVPAGPAAVEHLGDQRPDPRPLVLQNRREPAGKRAVHDGKGEPVQAGLPGAAVPVQLLAFCIGQVVESELEGAGAFHGRLQGEAELVEHCAGAPGLVFLPARQGLLQRDEPLRRTNSDIRREQRFQLCPMSNHAQPFCLRGVAGSVRFQGTQPA